MRDTDRRGRIVSVVVSVVLAVLLAGIIIAVKSMYETPMLLVD